MKGKCLFCNNNNAELTAILGDAIIVNCPVCGKYTYTSSAETDSGLYPEKEKVAAFLFYNKPKDKKKPISAYFFGTNDEFEQQGNNKLRFITEEDIENWYPGTFSEKLNRMLLYFAENSDVYGAVVELSFEEACSCMFVKRFGSDGSVLSNNKLIGQMDFITKYLEDSGLLEGRVLGANNSFRTEVSYKGWQRVDELQKDEPKSLQKNVFVAMAFARGMEPVREAIKRAIHNCGYVPRIMDEIEHNHQIVPEMLYEIRQARFVIAELTGHNNGAYYEAGYALGLGKDIIHVCKNDQFGSDGHFDVKQVNTVLWDSVDELADKLAKRIRATIE